jgi:UDP-N-acetylglucosamine diphosphorylase / glucose-1-phosphate thymidylyltransferase / UDP-N-acetylgalactosamine diphosphorylase / glucosamine-1-phosphate N-acetyltransferase / galactosamine-1-phosphate N-acetyltransferase
MRLCLVEDGAVTALEPLSLTRPVFDLMLGSRTLGQKAARAFGVDWNSTRRGALVRSHLVGPQRASDPKNAVNDHAWLTRGPVVVVNGRWVPPADFQAPHVRRPMVGLCDGQVACAWVGPGQAMGLELHKVDDWFDEMASDLDVVDVGGEWICRPWDLVAKNADHLTRDFATSKKVGRGDRHLGHGALVGPADRLYIHPTAQIDPYTVFDTTGGAISIEAGAIIQPFTRVEGPCSIGEKTQLFRANICGGVTIGPNCRIGGEVEQSIVHGHSNKYHEGFLGHAYVGEWVNLGAITSNSDLRNDYGEVSVPLGGYNVATQLTKVGCFLGDHTRTGLGSLMNTGTAIGVMCNILPAGLLLPKHVPSFSAVRYGRVAPGFSLDQLFATATIAMGRRGKEFTEVQRQLYLDLYEQTRLERERAFLRASEPCQDPWQIAEARP